MPNAPRSGARRLEELQQHAYQRAGADPLAVRTVRGQRSYTAAPGFGFERLKSDDADEAVPALRIEEIRTAAEKDALFDLRQFSAAGLYLEFLDDNGAVVALDNASVATVTAWRRQDNGDMVRGPVFADLGHRVEQTDETVIGRVVYYQITAVTFAGGAAAVRLRVAGEGLGFQD